MLTLIDIRDFALIEHAAVEFGGGFNVVTGESGAGKSILMSAVGLLLGERADKGAIRTGADRCIVSGVFSVPENSVAVIAEELEAAGVPFDLNLRELFLRRSISQSSTRNFINDVPVSAAFLGKIGSRLIDRTGAGDQMALTQSARQLELLDSFGDLESARQTCAEICRKRQELAAERAEFEKTLPDAAEAERLTAMLEEIAEVNPEPGEDVKLEGQFRLGSNSRQVIETASGLVELLNDGDDSIADRLGTVFHELSELRQFDETLIAELLSDVGVLQENVENLTRKITAMREKVDLNPEELNAIEQRLSALYTIRRRYGPTLEQLFSARDRAELRVKEFRDSERCRLDFDERDRKLGAGLDANAKKLSEARKKAAEKLVANALKKLAAVGFLKCGLEAKFSEIQPGPTGCDHLELLFSANPGEEAKPLRKVASSGELSRLELAIKTVLADADSTATLVFDEIDMNIGGETANRVGDELRKLGEKRQILCISHLAQVAARADAHFLVEKRVNGDRTISTVRRLDDSTEELARMLGGSQGALRHATELLNEQRVK